MVKVSLSRIAFLIRTATGHVVDGQIGLTLAEDIVFLLLLHIRALVVGLVEDELIRTCSTDECIWAIRMIFARLRGCDGQTIAAVWANYRQSVRSTTRQRIRAYMSVALLRPISEAGEWV